MSASIKRFLGLVLASLLTLGIAGCTDNPANVVPQAGPAFATVTSSRNEVPSTLTSFQTTLTLAGAALAAQLGTDAVLLGEGFQDMTVTALDHVDDGRVTVDVAGPFAVEPGGMPYAHGTISLAPGAIPGWDEPALVRIPITHPMIGAVSEAMAYDAGVMSVYVSLSRAEFADALTPGMFTVVSRGKPVAVTAVERTYQTEARLSLAMSATDLDDAIRQLRGGTVTAASDALSISTELSGSTTISTADVEGHITTLADTGDAIAVSVNLSPRRGYFDGLTPSSLTFTGDFAGARDVRLTPTELGAAVSFTLPRLASIDQTVVSGMIHLRDGTLKNPWGSVAEDASVVLKWAGNQPKGAVDSAIGFWAEYGGTISSVGNAVSGAAKVFGAGKAILEMFGVIESTDSRVKDIQKDVKAMKAEVAAVHHKVNAIQAEVAVLRQQSREMMELLTDVHKETVKTQAQLAQIARDAEIEAAARNWGEYLKDLRRLESLTTSFKNLTLTAVFDIVKNGTVTVSKDTQGNVAMIVSPITGRTNTGWKMAPGAVEYTLPADLVRQIVAAGKIRDGDLDQLQRLLSAQHGPAAAQDVVDSIALESVYVTAAQGKFDHFTTQFFDVVAALNGNGLGTKSPLFYHDIVVESAFNWEPDTHPAKNQMRLYVATVLADAAVTAMGYVSILQSNSIGEITRIQDALAGAVGDVLTKNTGIRPPAPEHYAYSTHARQPVTILLARPYRHADVWNEAGMYVTAMIEGNRYLDIRAWSVDLGNTGASRHTIPELLSKPVLSSVQLALMGKNAALRNTNVFAELEALGLTTDLENSDRFDPRDPVDDGFPSVARLYSTLTFAFRGDTWGYSGEYWAPDGTVRSYSEDLLRNGNGLARPINPDRFPLWAYFSAS